MLNSSDAPALKKILEYDPYLDANLIPKVPEKLDSPEAQAIKKQADERLDKLRNDKEANIIFARQDYQLKDGVSLGLEREKTYLYLSAEDSFLNDGEAKLRKNVQSLQRAPAEVEKQVIETVDKERKEADAGLGFVFG